MMPGVKTPEMQDFISNLLFIFSICLGAAGLITVTSTALIDHAKKPGSPLSEGDLICAVGLLLFGVGASLFMALLVYAVIQREKK